MAKSIAHTIESLKQAMYTASPVPGKLQVQLDLDRIARELTDIEAYLIDKHGLAVATTLVVPLVKLREKVLWYSRMAKPMPYEKFLALRGEADAVLNRIKMAATTSPAPVDHEDDPPLDYEDESILRALARKAPRLLTEYEIEAD